MTPLPRYIFNPDTITDPNKRYLPVINGVRYQVGDIVVIKNRYYDEDEMAELGLEFLDDGDPAEPESFLSPVVCSATGSGSVDLEVPDDNGPVNMYGGVSTGSMTIYFNNNTGSGAKSITVFPNTSGVIAYDLDCRTVKTINIRPSGQFTVYLMRQSIRGDIDTMMRGT